MVYFKFIFWFEKHLLVCLSLVLFSSFFLLSILGMIDMIHSSGIHPIKQFRTCNLKTPNCKLYNKNNFVSHFLTFPLKSNKFHNFWKRKVSFLERKREREKERKIMCFDNQISLICSLFLYYHNQISLITLVYFTMIIKSPSLLNFFPVFIISPPNTYFSLKCYLSPSNV